MVNPEKIIGYTAFLLIAFCAAILWLINWILGLGFTLFTIAVMTWYLKTKEKGDTYLREVAKIIKCSFSKGGPGYGSVHGQYKGRKIEINVQKSFSTGRGLAGLAISYSLAKSLLGVVAGIENFTVVKVEHRANVEKPYELEEGIYVDKNLLIYLPPSNKATGIPYMSPRALAAKIKYLTKKAEEIETSITA